MKRYLIVFVFLLLAGTSPAHAVIRSLSPDEIISTAEYIVAGEVVDVRAAEEQPDFLVRVDTVYKGELGAAMLTVPLPARPKDPASAPQWMTPPEAGDRLLLFFAVNEQFRFIPVADFNWAAVLRDNQAEALFMGAGYNSWSETDYLLTYNRFLAETPGKEIPPAESGGGEDSDREKPPGTVNPWVFFAVAGVFLIVLLAAGRRKRAKM